MTAAKTQLYVRSSTKTLNSRKNPLNLLSRGKRDFLEQCKNICMQNIEKMVSLEQIREPVKKKVWKISP